MDNGSGRGNQVKCPSPLPDSMTLRRPCHRLRRRDQSYTSTNGSVVRWYISKTVKTVLLILPIDCLALGAMETNRLGIQPDASLSFLGRTSRDNAIPVLGRYSTPKRRPSRPVFCPPQEVYNSTCFPSSVGHHIWIRCSPAYHRLLIL